MERNFTEENARILANVEEYHRKQFLKSTTYFKMGSGWAGYTVCKPNKEKFWVHGNSIDDCKEKLLDKYYYDHTN